MRLLGDTFDIVEALRLIDARLAELVARLEKLERQLEQQEVIPPARPARTKGGTL
jgi:hypothetical protein